MRTDQRLVDGIELNDELERLDSLLRTMEDSPWDKWKSYRIHELEKLIKRVVMGARKTQPFSEVMVA